MKSLIIIFLLVPLMFQCLQSCKNPVGSKQESLNMDFFKRMDSLQESQGPRLNFRFSYVYNINREKLDLMVDFHIDSTNCSLMKRKDTAIRNLTVNIKKTMGMEEEAFNNVVIVYNNGLIKSNDLLAIEMISLYRIGDDRWK